MKKGLAIKLFVSVLELWKARNNITFFNEIFSLQKLKREFVCFLVYLWVVFLVALFSNLSLYLSKKMLLSQLKLIKIIFYL